MKKQKKEKKALVTALFPQLNMEGYPIGFPSDTTNISFTVSTTVYNVYPLKLLIDSPIFYLTITVS